VDRDWTIKIKETSGRSPQFPRDISKQMQVSKSELTFLVLVGRSKNKIIKVFRTTASIQR
jgi:hypothetical protein